MPVLIFALYAVAEVAALIWVGSALGVLPTVGLLVLGSLLGGYLLRREGQRGMQAIREAQRQGLPAQRHRQADYADVALRTGGALLLLVPGFVSAVLGLLLLLPPTRWLLRPVLKTVVARRVQVMTTNAFARFPGMGPGPAGGAGRFPGGHRQGGYGDVIDGEVVDVHDEGPSGPPRTPLTS
ncbi:FxsA family protein [Rhodococcus sp. X156]|uniref:FxsA family protein n=1 Tax=Rhodococcus sp. X156 TaxID=2499145 RepID=UPI000FD73B6A|nr:FxsA family protein [Rhodococcus sp. X156]